MSRGLSVTKVPNVYLSRAGIIIRKDILSLGMPLYNVHCMDIPKSGGLGADECALEARAFSQRAVLHTMAEKIDEGEIKDTEPFYLDPSLNFRANEDRAYDAGIRFLSPCWTITFRTT